MELASIKCFKDLDESQQARLREASTEQMVKSGDTLIREGEPSHSMYFVVSGRFSISVSSRDTAIAEIGAGQTIGEIGFLSGEYRTATATAIRDSIVLRLARADYEMLCDTFPALLRDVSVSLAKKLTIATARLGANIYSPPRTIALCPAGNSLLSTQFIDQLQHALGKQGACKVLREQDVSRHYSTNGIPSTELSHWLNEQENEHRFVVYVVENIATDWTATALRQSDIVLLLADTEVASSNNENATDNLKPNPAEELLDSLELTTPRWLVLVHRTHGVIKNSAQWFDRRSFDQYHHIRLDDNESIHRLARFIHGHARGLIASGGGAYTAAHIGCFRALQDAGLKFDIVGGASGGAAMIAAVAAGLDYFELVDRTEQMMVKSGALKKLTLPVYSLLDHTFFDQCLKDHYGDFRIEDSWLRYFAVSTNLSTGKEMLHDRGAFWKAVRASSSIPGLLPPVVAESGDLLVDGGILDSVPLKRMKSIKHGPNIILSFEPKHQSRAGVDYDKLPNRKQLFSGLLKNGLGGPDLDMPKIGSVLTQSMLLNNSSLDEATETDLVLNMSLPRDLKLNDWHRHREMADIGYRLASDWLEQVSERPGFQQFKNQSSDDN